jgi:MGT family glycosyltransferase
VGKSGRFLLATWDGGGNIPPELGVARRLVERGHRVHVLGDPTIRSAADAAGCTFNPWRLAPSRRSLHPADDLFEDWETSSPLFRLRRVRDRLIAGPSAAFAADTVAAIAAFRAHVVMTDAFLFGAIMAGQAAGLPVVALLPTICVLPERGAPSFGPGFPLAKSVLGRTRDAAVSAVATRMFSRGLPALNAARAGLGLPPLQSFADQAHQADRILVLSSETFDYASPYVAANARYVGPVLDDPDWVEPWESPWPAANRDPLVVVGLSPTFQEQTALLGRIGDALSTLPVRAVVTLGQMLPSNAVVPTANVAVVQSAPHSQLFAGASAVVSHGGHGTTMRALAAGVPLVCLPMGRDQRDVAARVAHHGAGIRLSPLASAHRIRRAVTTVLTDVRYRAGAGQLADTMATEHGPLDAITELESLVDADPMAGEAGA